MLAFASQSIPCELTLETGLLFVALKVYDVTAGFPGTIVGSPILMTEYDDGAYGAEFTGIAGKNYVTSKAVYTDGTYATRDSAYPSGSDAFQVVEAPTGQTFQQLDEIEGTIEDESELTGSIEDC